MEATKAEIDLTKSFQPLIERWSDKRILIDLEKDIEDLKKAFDRVKRDERIITIKSYIALILSICALIIAIL